MPLKVSAWTLLVCLGSVLEYHQTDGTEYSEKVIMDPKSYSYSYASPIGPRSWKSDVCYIGERQSPINLDDIDSIPVEYPPLELIGHWDEREDGFILKNTGHSAEVQFSGEAPFLRGGPVTSEYVLAQIHFHWGNSTTLGSEHSVDGHFFAMEAHLVHYKEEYGSVANAAGHLDGLVVVGIFLKSTRGNNPEFNDIVDGLEDIEEEGSETDIGSEAMKWLEAYGDMQNYYTYLGSLTTPPCSEIVNWIVMKEHAIIGQRQLEEFKGLEGHEGEIESNVRPVQPIQGRQVYRSVSKSASSTTSSSRLISLIPILISVAFYTKRAALIYLD